MKFDDNSGHDFVFNLTHHIEAHLYPNSRVLQLAVPAAWCMISPLRPLEGILNIVPCLRKLCDAAFTIVSALQWSRTGSHSISNHLSLPYNL